MHLSILLNAAPGFLARLEAGQNANLASPGLTSRPEASLEKCHGAGNLTTGPAYHRGTSKY